MPGSRTKQSGSKTLHKTLHPLADRATTVRLANDGTDRATVLYPPSKVAQHRVLPMKADVSGVPDSIPREPPNGLPKNLRPGFSMMREAEISRASLPEKTDYRQTEQAHCTARPQTIREAMPTLPPFCGRRQAAYN